MAQANRGLGGEYNEPSVLRIFTLASLVALFGGCAPPGVAPLPPDSRAAREALQSVWAEKTPNIDGNVGDEEWRRALRIEVPARSGNARCFFYFMNDEENLYVGVAAVNDTTNANRGRAAGGFDNMAIWFGAEIGYWLYGNGELRSDRIVGGSRTTFPFGSAAEARVLGPPKAEHMMYELLIPLKEVGIQPGETVAIGFHYWDNYNRGPSFWWPSGVSVWSASSYGALTLSRRP